MTTRARVTCVSSVFALGVLTSMSGAFAMGQMLSNLRSALGSITQPVRHHVAMICIVSRELSFCQKMSALGRMWELATHGLGSGK